MRVKYVLLITGAVVTCGATAAQACWDESDRRAERGYVYGYTASIDDDVDYAYGYGGPSVAVYSDRSWRGGRRGYHRRSHVNRSGRTARTSVDLTPAPRRSSDGGMRSSGGGSGTGGRGGSR